MTTVSKDLSDWTLDNHGPSFIDISCQMAFYAHSDYLLIIFTLLFRHSSMFELFSRSFKMTF